MRHHGIATGSAVLASFGLVVTACGGLGGIGGLGSASSLPDVERAAVTSPHAAELAEGINGVGYRLFVAAGEGSDADLVISPLSIGLAFGMVDLGATGATAASLEDLFAYPVDDEARWSAFNTLERSITEHDDLVVRLANRQFPDVSFDTTDGYDEELARWFGAGIEPLPLRAEPEESRRHINRWVSERTEQLIPELLPQGFLSEHAALVLVNALYLEAAWGQPFDANITSPAPFTRLDGSDVQIELMRGADTERPTVQTDAFAAVELRYAGDLTMLLIVPEAGHYPGVEARLSDGLIAEIDAEAADRNVSVLLPRFRSETELHLRDLLEGALGVRNLFSVEGFEGIGPETTLEDVIHAATIEVDEHGTIAAAATAMQLDGSAEAEAAAVVVRADRPFLYLVRHEPTGAVLFVGRVLDPTPFSSG
jgi:serpin B